jgi:hypothetical protein
MSGSRVVRRQAVLSDAKQAANLRDVSGVRAATVRSTSAAAWALIPRSEEAHFAAAGAIARMTSGDAHAAATGAALRRRRRTCS